MRNRQRGVTALGWLILLTPFAIVLYGGIRLAPIYLNYMNVTKALTQISTEIPSNSATADSIRASLYRHFDVSGVTFPDPKDIKITRADGRTAT